MPWTHHDTREAAKLSHDGWRTRKKAEAEMEKVIEAERAGVPQPALHTLANAAAKDATDFAFWLGRAAIYHSRGDADLSDCTENADRARTRLIRSVERIKEFEA